MFNELVLLRQHAAAVIKIVDATGHGKTDYECDALTSEALKYFLSIYQDSPLTSFLESAARR
jgi:hypothetical protein